MSFISVRQVSKRFGATAALTDVGFDVERGRIHGLLGENGAGKSTLMKVLSGMLRPDEGVVRVDGMALPLGIRKHPEGPAWRWLIRNSVPRLTSPSAPNWHFRNCRAEQAVLFR
ncbi:ATP-binding cassette domain-containing protein [Arthrobacter sp. SA17]